MNDKLKKMVLYFSILVFVVGIILVGVGEGMKKKISDDMKLKLSQKMADALKSGDQAAGQKIMTDFLQENTDMIKEMQKYDTMSLSGVILAPIGGFVVLVYLAVYFMAKYSSNRMSTLSYGHSRKHRR